MIRVFILLLGIPLYGLAQAGCNGETDFLILGGEVDMNLRDAVGGPDYRIGADLKNDGPCTVPSVTMIVERLDEDGNVIEQTMSINLTSPYSPGQSRGVGVNFNADTFGIIFGAPYKVSWIPDILDTNLANNEGITIALDQILVDSMEDPFIPCPLPPPFCPPTAELMVAM